VYRINVRDITNLNGGSLMSMPTLLRACYSEHCKQSSVILMCFVQPIMPTYRCIKFFLSKSWLTHNYITLKTSWNTND
jgi:hypothetical protein